MPVSKRCSRRAISPRRDILSVIRFALKQGKILPFLPGLRVMFRQTGGRKCGNQARDRLFSCSESSACFSLFG